MTIDFKQEVLNHKEDLLKDLFELLSVRSILGTDITEETPFGSGPREALDLILSFGKRDGYKIKQGTLKWDKEKNYLVSLDMSM